MTEFYIWGPKGRSPHPSIYSKDKNGNFYNYGTDFFSHCVDAIPLSISHLITIKFERKADKAIKEFLEDVDNRTP